MTTTISREFSCPLLPVIAPLSQSDKCSENKWESFESNCIIMSSISPLSMCDSFSTISLIQSKQENSKVCTKPRNNAKRERPPVLHSNVSNLNRVNEIEELRKIPPWTSPPNQFFSQLFRMLHQDCSLFEHPAFAEKPLDLSSKKCSFPSRNPAVQDSWNGLIQREQDQRKSVFKHFDKRSSLMQRMIRSEEVVKQPHQRGSSGHGAGKQPVPRCFECKRLFASLSDLNRHFLREHQLILQREFTLNRSWKTYALENVCMQQLQITLRKGSIGKTGYPCPHCDYFAKWPTELQKHIMVHSTERPHQCIICGLTYKWKWDLGRHFDKSHGHAVNPYKKKSDTSPSPSLAIRETVKSKRRKKMEHPMSISKGPEDIKCLHSPSVKLPLMSSAPNSLPLLLPTTTTPQHSHSSLFGFSFPFSTIVPPPFLLQDSPLLRNRLSSFFPSNGMLTKSVWQR